MDIRIADDQHAWDSFLAEQHYRPFLQSWTMGEVYGDIGQKPIRLIATEENKTQAICFGHIVPARRGKHLSIPYGPVIDSSLNDEQKQNVLTNLLAEISSAAKKHGCAFVRMSPFWPKENQSAIEKTIQSPLHLLAEHVWYLPLTQSDSWQPNQKPKTRNQKPVTESELLAVMRKTTRNLIGRAGRDGVTVSASKDPVNDLAHFIRLHDETRKRHGFTPYTNQFFRSQVQRFSERKELTVYLAHFQGEVIATSIHMHAFGETSYHHGASSSLHNKIPASYLLQWTAIQDALKRGDHAYNFWGIAPVSDQESVVSGQSVAKKHPFAGVTLFKTGFGGKVMNLTHCIDLPVSKKYWLTYGFETFRKWRRGF